MGGSGYPAPHGKSFRKKTLTHKISDWVDESLRELYKDIVTSDAPEQLKENAGFIVHAFAKTEAAIPKAKSVNWDSFEQDLQAVSELLALYSEYIVYVKHKEIIDDDDEIIRLLN